MGVAGPIVIDIGTDIREVDGEVSIEGRTSVDAAFIAALQNEELYVNLHTELNPDGEIRGQLVWIPGGI